MELESEDNVAGFLGVHIEQREDDTIKMTQKGSIQQIINALNITDNCTTKNPQNTERLVKMRMASNLRELTATQV